MAESYWVNDSAVVVIKESAVKKYRVVRCYHIFKRACTIVFLYLACGAITYFTYSKGIDVEHDISEASGISLSDCIATGALLATFGSSIVAVLSLLANKSRNMFYLDLDIFNREFFSDCGAHSHWKKWPFLPRWGKIALQGKTRYVGVNNATVYFQTANKQVVIPLPTESDDFHEIPIVRSYLCMRLNRRAYFNYLSTSALIDEYPAWDCVYAILKNVLLYRLSCLGIWVGAFLIVHSIMFSFSYPFIYQIIIA